MVLVDFDEPWISNFDSRLDMFWALLSPITDRSSLGVVFPFLYGIQCKRIDGYKGRQPQAFWF